MASPGVLLDIDGTLLDTNHLHTLAWWRAFRSLDLTFPMARIHRLVGMGGDKLVPALAGREVEGAEERYAEEFDRLYEDVTLLPGARRLAERLHEAGLVVILASSARGEDLDRFRSLLDIDDLLDGATSSGDADASKPDPEIFDVAIERYGLDRALTFAIGDTVWDAEAAGRAGVGFIGVESGGSDGDVLRRAGASRVYADCAELADQVERSPLAPVLAAARRSGATA